MSDTEKPESVPTRKKYVRAVGPRLRLLLYFIFALVAILGANSAYLASITFLGWLKGLSYENFFYQYMFLAHLVLGLLLVAPVILFGIFHIKNAHDRPNRRAVRVGYALFSTSVILLVSGLALMRIEGFEIKNPETRSLAYWAHVITPLLAIWLYILHRLAGPRIQWKVGVSWAAVVGAAVAGMVWLHSQDPRRWSQVGPAEGTNYFHPSLARTASGNFIPARTLMMDEYCLQCHPDAYQGWYHSVHHFSSFNNPAYLFTIKETRQVVMKRDGNVKASRWCAGCHDPVPFFSGAFDDPNYDLEKHPTSQAGITCTTCHAITHVNSARGNSDYTIEQPIHYPFAFSSNAVLRFINRVLVKAKPEFHKKTFLKPLHKTAEFCSTCHKVSLPFDLTHYKEFLRGQNHYDAFLLSGVSGHSARSFYYPPKAEANCNHCHLPLKPSSDFGAKYFDDSGQLTIHDHLFPSANTGIAYLRGQPEVVRAHQKFLRDTLRLDIFGLKEGGTIDGKLTAPLRPKLPALKRGQTYLLEVVLRTLKVGHLFTQGTVDSNEIWVDAKVTSGDRIVGRSGGMGALGEVDPWSHFVNVYMLDREGNRIDRRNAQDIFTPLYNNQIPPGAGQVVHYRFTVPEDASGPLTFEVKLNYRKFDATYMQYVYGRDFTNDLPVTTICGDAVSLPVEGVDAGSASRISNPESKIPEWQRWNDYGIGLLLKGNRGSEKGELIQATEAFAQVEKLGRADGPLNLTRVYFKEGRLDDAVAALQRAAHFDPPAPRWVVAWFNGLVNQQNGFLDKAISEFRSILEDRYPELDRRGFDFSKDYIVINQLGETIFERAKAERGEARKAAREMFLKQAAEQFQKTLAIDSENATAHYNLALIYAQLGDEQRAAEQRRLHERYRPDDNARDRAITIQRRRHPAADHAAQAIVIYSLQRAGAPGWAEPSPSASVPGRTAGSAGGVALTEPHSP
jgi:tetratricopeptide (TPR) repeat protein